jgi:hypothetical protein
MDNFIKHIKHVWMIGIGLVVCYWHVKTVYWHLKMGPTYCSKIKATSPQEQRPQLHHSRSLKFHTSKWYLQTLMILKPKCFKFINMKINSITFSFATECPWAQQLDCVCVCHVRLCNTLHWLVTHFTHFIWTRSPVHRYWHRCLCIYSIHNTHSYKPVSGMVITQF